MSERPPTSLFVLIFLISLNTLMLEILLIRVFDTIFLANFGYVVITSAMFGLGLAGIYTAIYPPGQDPRRRIVVFTLLLIVSVLLVRPMLNATQAAYFLIPSRPLRIVFGGGAIYLSVVIPFVLAGLIFSYLFAAFPSRINRLYFWDLAGAAVGCVIFLPFIRQIGPGGLMIAGAGSLAIAAAVVVRAGLGSRVLVGAGIILLLAPFIRTEGYFDFVEFRNKRGVRDARAEGRIEWSEWDPISKIYVAEQRQPRLDNEGRAWGWKHIMYDGGSQSSHFNEFDGDYARLRRAVLSSGPIAGFLHRGVLASHYLRRDTGSKVLVIGSAGGQETRAALLFGASHVDGIELVEAVVTLGKGPYSEFIGGIFNDPRVDVKVGEGRSFLRSTDEAYDIIQIYSNHTSSNIATGIGATTPVYLQTVEAYMEFFSHLSNDGILHVNHHFYPRMVTTAAEAWSRMGKGDFQSHVAVFERANMVETLPTLLVKRTPWTREELDQIKAFMSLDPDASTPWRLVVDPLRPAESFLSEDFFTTGLPEDLLERVPYKVSAATDDQPYFSNIQRSLEPVAVDPERFLNVSMVSAVNGRLNWFAGEYTVFVVVAIGGLACSLALVLLPLLFSSIGTVTWPGKYAWLGYFACLGAAFIIVELVLIQLFMKPIGFPLYTFALVLFTLLLGAGLGSLLGSRLGVRAEGRWAFPFVLILVIGTLFTLTYPSLFQRLLELPLGGRLVGSAALILPLGFFMGMPFPLGILSIKDYPRGAIAWAWGMNALFTVVGGMACGLLSIQLGFRTTLVIGLSIYAGAFLLISRLLTRGPLETPVEAVVR